MFPFRAILASLAFISLGLPDGLLGVAWPSIRGTFGLRLDAVGALLISTTAGYVASSFSSGHAARFLNVGTLVGASCALTGLALLGYASTTSWLLLIALGACLGTGAGAVDAVLNTYAATRHGHGMLNWLHACYGIGAASGPLLMTAVLARDLPWQRGYLLVGLGQLVLAGAFLATSRSWISSGGSGHEGAHAPITSTLRVRGAQLGVFVFLLYAGVEASMGLWTYTLLVESRSVPRGTAGWIVSLFWGGLTAGRLVAAGVAGRVPAHHLVPLCLTLVLFGTLLLWTDGGVVLSAAGVALAGIACGPIFPTLIATTPARVGRDHAGNAVGFQVAAAAAGMAFLPALVGALAAAMPLSVIATTFVLFAAGLCAGYAWLQSESGARPT
jgi:fucose permease